MKSLIGKMKDLRERLEGLEKELEYLLEKRAYSKIAVEDEEQLQKEYKKFPRFERRRKHLKKRLLQSKKRRLEDVNQRISDVREEINKVRYGLEKQADEDWRIDEPDRTNRKPLWFKIFVGNQKVELSRLSVTLALKTLKIRNLGTVKQADIKFTKGINIIYGKGASGKTTILNAIRHVLIGEELLYRPSHDKKNSEKAIIEIELLGKKMSTEIKEQSPVYEECLRKGILPNGKRIPPGIESPESLKNVLSAGEKVFLEFAEAIRMISKEQAILLDDVFRCLDKEHRKIAFDMLKKSNIQVIMTARHKDDLIKDANVIKLKRLKGFYHGT